MKMSRIESDLRCHVPDEALESVRGIFDVVAEIESFPPRGMDGFDQETLRFGKGLNIIHGRSGSGRTRILGVIQAIHGQESGAVFLKRPRDLSTDWHRLSHGQRIMAMVRVLLETMPEGSCLLMDDALDFLDQECRRKIIDGLLKGLLKAGRQVILVADERYVGELKAICGSRARFFPLAG